RMRRLEVYCLDSRAPVAFSDASPAFGPDRNIRGPFRPDMDKDAERAFLETMSRALVSLPFDLKVLLEAVADSDLERAVRELAAATVVHVITPKDGNVEAPLRFSEDVLLLRLALAKIVAEGGEYASTFRERFVEDLTRFDEDMKRFRQTLGDDIVDWLDTRWGAL